MKLIWKFNLVLLGVFIVGFVVGGLRFEEDAAWKRARRDPAARAADDGGGAGVAHLHEHASEAAARRAAQDEFLPQTVPAYAATEQFNDLHKSYRDYTYKEATLNPTNPRDRASDWEADVVNTSATRRRHRRSSASATRRPAARSISRGRSRSRAARASNATARVEVAPKTMLDVYGNANGFGWKMNEMIGAQVVSVPMAVPIERANHTLRTFHGLARAASSLLTSSLLNADALHHRDPPRDAPRGHRRRRSASATSRRANSARAAGTRSAC